MSNMHLIVPYRKHSLIECHYLIMKLGNLHDPAKRTKPDDNDLAAWIDACGFEGRDLTKWEEGFIASVSEQWANTGRLTEKQIEVLERIYTEKVK